MLGVGGRSGRVVTIWINMSAVHSYSPSSSAAAPSHLFSLLLHLTCSLIKILFLFTLSPSLRPLCLPSFFKSHSPSVNHSPLTFPFSSLLIFLRCQLPSPRSPPMATCHSINLFFFSLNHCLHHLSPSSISLSFFCDRQSPSFPHHPPPLS